MVTDVRPHGPAFRGLRRDLLRRRLAQFDPRLRGEIALLAVVIGGFLFWQARIPFDGVRRAHGIWAVARQLSLILGAIVVSSAGLVGFRHARQLRSALPGPAWLALPLPPASIIAHLAWEARLSAGWGAALAPGFLVAAFGLLPLGLLLAIAAGFSLALWLLARLATAIAARIVIATHRPVTPGRNALHDLLLSVKSASAGRRVRPARWGRAAAWLTLWRKDVRLALRSAPARARAAVPLLLGAAACSVWLLPLEAPAARFIAFATGLVAAAGMAEFLIELAGEDPLPVLKTLPLGGWTLWRGRVAWVALFAVLLAAGQAMLARPLAPHARDVLLVWQTCASIAITLLGVNYGITLAAHPHAAQRFLTLTLTISMAASLMIPLVGWLVLLTAVIHSARRVPRWARLEADL